MVGDSRGQHRIESSPIKIALSLASNVNRRAMEYVVLKIDQEEDGNEENSIEEDDNEENTGEEDG